MPPELPEENTRPIATARLSADVSEISSRCETHSGCPRYWRSRRWSSR